MHHCADNRVASAGSFTGGQIASFVSPIYLLHLYCTYIVSLPLWPINIHDACFSFSVSVYHLRYSSLLQLQQCNCFQCGLFWLPTLSIFASSCFFTIIALRCCCEDFGFHSCPIFQGLLCLLFNHLFGIGRGLRVRAFFGCTCAKFLRVWFLSTTDGQEFLAKWPVSSASLD